MTWRLHLKVTIRIKFPINRCAHFDFHRRIRLINCKDLERKCCCVPKYKTQNREQFEKTSYKTSLTVLLNTDSEVRSLHKFRYY